MPSPCCQDKCNCAQTCKCGAGGCKCGPNGLSCASVSCACTAQGVKCAADCPCPQNCRCCSTCCKWTCQRYISVSYFLHWLKPWYVLQIKEFYLNGVLLATIFKHDEYPLATGLLHQNEFKNECLWKMFFKFIFVLFLWQRKVRREFRDRFLLHI